MFFLNLTGTQLLTLLGALGGLITALYLLDRAKRRKVVSTLHFWVQAGASEQRQARRRMRDPWSLVLQLFALLLLLLAISRMQWGSPDRRGHDHVLLLDTSSWSAAPSSGDPAGTVLDTEKVQAIRYLSALPRTDRAMLVSAASLATPLTRFTADHKQLRAALVMARSGFSALNPDAVLSFSRQAQNWSGGGLGEIVYFGPQLADQAVSAKAPGRIVAVSADRENFGIQQLSVQQVEDEANSWHAWVRLKNYGNRPQTARLQVSYGGTNFALRRVPISPGEESTAEYDFTTRTPGQLTASLNPGGSLRSDDRASLFLPRTGHLRVAVFTDRPEILKPLLQASRQLEASFFPPSQYKAQYIADVVILDHMGSSAAVPESATLWIDPPPDRSPLSVKLSLSDPLLSWNPQGPLDSPFHAKPLRVPSANTFEIFEGDETVISAAEGPVVVVRAAASRRPKSAIIGFDPAAGALRFNLATPLLFADLLQWLDPTAFRTLTFTARQVGLADVTLDRSELRGDLRVTDDRGLAAPSTIRAGALQVFAARPAALHVTSAERERVISFSLPAVAGYVWKPSGDPLIGLPSAARFTPPALDLWKWLALAAAALLLLEWILFGRVKRARKLRLPVSRGENAGVKPRERELAAK